MSALLGSSFQTFSVRLSSHTLLQILCWKVQVLSYLGSALTGVSTKEQDIQCVISNQVVPYLCRRLSVPLFPPVRVSAIPYLSRSDLPSCWPKAVASTWYISKYISVPSGKWTRTVKGHSSNYTPNLNNSQQHNSQFTGDGEKRENSVLWLNFSDTLSSCSTASTWCSLKSLEVYSSPGLLPPSDGEKSTENHPGHCWDHTFLIHGNVTLTQIWESGKLNLRINLKDKKTSVYLLQGRNLPEVFLLGQEKKIMSIWAKSGSPLQPQPFCYSEQILQRLWKEVNYRGCFLQPCSKAITKGGAN